MRVVKCENGHFFDLMKNQVCPKCGSDDYVFTGAEAENNVTLDKKAIRAQAKQRRAEEKLREKEYRKRLKTMKKYGDDFESVSMSPLINSMTGEELKYSMEPDGDFVDYRNNTDNGPTVLPVDDKTRKLDDKTINIPTELLLGKSEAKPQIDISDEKTVYYEDFDTPDTEPVVGWLVCIEGNDNGNSYTLKSGVNNIGRSADMDVSVRNDIGVSRDRHSILMYEAGNRKFYIKPGIGRGITYLNGMAVLKPEELKERDCIQIGKTKLVFVPLCSEQFGWE